VSNLYGSGAGNFCDNVYHTQIFLKYIIIYVGDEFHSLIDIIPWKACLEPAV
jgi:hypothetical protein